MQVAKLSILRGAAKNIERPVAVFKLPGVGGIQPLTVFSTPLIHCQILYRGVSYILYTYDLHHNFVPFSTVEKFNSLS